MCPLHSGADNPTSFHVKQDGHWHCYSCRAWGSDLASLLAAVRGIGFNEARKIIDDMPSLFHEVRDGLLPPWDHRVEPEDKVLPEKALARYKAYCPSYLLERGFSADILQRYEIGYCFETSKVVFPVRSIEGKLVGLTFRRDGDVDDGEPKYRHAQFDKSHHLYGLHLFRNEGGRLFLTEGQLDSIRMVTLGASAAAIMGNTISVRQALLLERCLADEIILLLDNDQGGRDGLNASLPVLLRFPGVSRRLHVGVYEGKDPDALQSLDQVLYAHWTRDLLTA